jgi:predicted  nucleic acid-binding Zn-ribbon protein
MNDEVIINELCKILKEDIITYKNIKKKLVNYDEQLHVSTSSEKIVNEIIKKISDFIDYVNESNTDFKSIGIYNNYDLSNYFINKNGIITSRKYIITKQNNDTYFLKPINHKKPYRFSKKDLVHYIFAG